MKKNYIKIFMLNLPFLLEYISKRKRKSILKEKYLCNGIYLQTIYSKLSKSEYRIIQRHIFKWQSRHYSEIDENLTFDFNINKTSVNTILNLINIFKLNNDTFFNYFLYKDENNNDSMYKYFKIKIKGENI